MRVAKHNGVSGTFSRELTSPNIWQENRKDEKGESDNIPVKTHDLPIEGINTIIELPSHFDIILIGL